MKATTTMKMTAILLMATALAAAAQGPGGPGGSRGRGPQGDEEGLRPPPPSAADMLKQFDADGDNKLDETELQEAIGARHQPPAPEDIAVQWVEEYDADGNGSLSPEELAVALEAHRPPRGPGGGPRGHRMNGAQGDRGQPRD